MHQVRYWYLYAIVTFIDACCISVTIHVLLWVIYSERKLFFYSLSIKDLQHLSHRPLWSLWPLWPPSHYHSYPLLHLDVCSLSLVCIKDSSTVVSSSISKLLSHHSLLPLVHSTSIPVPVYTSTTRRTHMFPEAKWTEWLPFSTKIRNIWSVWPVWSVWSYFNHFYRSAHGSV